MPDERPLMNEIIQLGAIKLNEAGDVVEELFLNVAPKFYHRVHYKVRELTGLTSRDIRNGTRFCDAMAALRDLCGEDSVIFTWSNMDLPILLQNMQMHGMYPGWIPAWYDLQLIYNAQTDTGSNQKALTAAAEHLGITMEAPLHDAGNDARFTAEILRRLDIPKGIREYYTKTPLPPSQLRRGPGGSVPLCGLKMFGHATLEQMFRDPAIHNVSCPVCSKVLEHQPWVLASTENGYLTAACCPEHGDYYYRLQFKNTGRTQWAGMLSVFPLNDAALAHYERQAGKLQKRRQKRKKTKEKPAKTVEATL